MEELVTAKEVAKMQGVHIQTIWKWVRDGKIPAYRIGKGRNLRFKLSEIPEPPRR